MNLNAHLNTCLTSISVKQQKKNTGKRNTENTDNQPYNNCTQHNFVVNKKTGSCAYTYYEHLSISSQPNKQHKYAHVNKKSAFKQ